MSKNDIIGLIITSILSLIILVLASFLLAGKGRIFLAGYNTMPKDEKSKYDEKKLCKFMGKIMLPIGIMIPFIAICAIYEIHWFKYFFIATTIVLLVIAMIFANGNRFKK